MNRFTNVDREQDCWNRIGVMGDRSCRELDTHVHCRNCPAYAQAAQRTLQIPVEASYRDAWADQLRQPNLQTPAGDASALLFRIGCRWLAIPAAMVESVAPLAPVHRLPHRDKPGLLGVVNIGGRLAPAVALGPLLGIDSAGTPDIDGRHVFPRLLVVGAGARCCALPVAELHGIVRYVSATLAAPHQPRAAHLDGVVTHDGIQAGLLNGAMLTALLEDLLR